MKRRILLFMVILGLSQLAKAQCVADAYFDKPMLIGYSAIFGAQGFSSGNGPMEYTWNFGDSSPDSITQSPEMMHDYALPGSYLVKLIASDQVYGCSDTFSRNIMIVDTNLNVTINPVVVYNQVTFTATVTGGSGDYEYGWSFDGGTFWVNTKKNIVDYNYHNTGLKSNELTVTDKSNNFSKTISDSVYVSNMGSCSLNANYAISFGYMDSVCNRVLFNANSDSPYAKYKWLFGDGTDTLDMGNMTNAAHEFPGAGDYTVQLIVLDSVLSCTFVYSDNVHIPEPISIPDFEAFHIDTNSMTWVFQPFEDGPNALTGGKGTFQYIWYIDTLYSYTGKHFVHQFTESDTGAKNIKLHIKEIDDDCEGFFEKAINVGSSGGQNCVQIMDILSQPDSLNPLNMYFTAQFTGSSNYKIIWSFGDGYMDSTINNPTIMHTYADTGLYYVCATLVDLSNTSCTSQACENLHLGQGNCMLSAFYTYWSIEGLTYQFESMIGAPDTNFTVTWDFGDGLPHSGNCLEYTFPNSGMFNVCVKAISTLDTSCYANYCDMLMIEDVGNDTNAIHAFFTYDIDTTGMGVQFHNYSNGEITDYSWSFGDGNYSTDMEPFHTYMYPGPYDVCLDIFNNNTGAWDSHCELIWIGSQSLCMAEFGGQPVDSGSLSFQFFNYSMNATNYNWEFGDGTFSQEFETIHEYPAPGYYNVCLSIMDSLSGCMNFVCHDILVGQDTTACFVDFTYTFDQNTNTFEFMPNISGNITDIYWDFGDGNGSSDMNPTHSYAEQGIYWVTVSIFNQMSGCQAMNYKEVIYGNVSCNANFNYFVDNSTHTAIFDNLSLGDNLSYFWDFGDGYASTLQYPQHTYQDQGTYWVTLAINNNNGCMDIKEEMITIGENLNCMVDYEYFVNTGSNEVFFNSLTTPNITNYFWNFGDGITSNETNPSHAYTEPGIYFVCLDAYDSVATNQPCANFVCKEIAVGVAPCNASYNVFIDSTTNTAMFNNTSTGDYSQNYWEFGDGYFSFEENPVHQYVAPGYYFTTLSVWNPTNGCMDLHEELILVGSSGVDCQANYSYYVDNATNTVVFNNTSVIQNQGGQFWYFGDDSISMDFQPVHTYAFPGIYDVCLSIWDPSGMCYNTFCDFVVVGDAINNINASFTYVIDTANNEVSFNNTSIGDIAGYYWDFGDGNFSNEDNPTHSYPTDSIYLAQLIAFGSSGITDDYFDVVNVNYGNGLYALFNYIIDSTNKANGHPVNFKGAVYGEPSRCVWVFGDGSSDSTAFNLTHNYQDTGMYYVCFTVIDHVTGDSSTQCQWIHVSDNTGSIVEFSNDIQFSSFPNPFRDEINIAYTLTKNEKVSIYIMDMFGNQVGEIQNNKMEAIGRKQIQFNAGNLSSGIYYLYVKIGDTNRVQKIVKL